LFAEVEDAGDVVPDPEAVHEPTAVQISQLTVVASWVLLGFLDGFFHFQIEVG
jgi:hypothetical protein